MDIKEFEKQREQELENIFIEAMAQMENLKTCTTLAMIKASNNNEDSKMDELLKKHKECTDEIISNLINRLDCHFDNTDYLTKMKYKTIISRLKNTMNNLDEIVK